ncbi:MAG: hypothetical protein CL943_00860 [Candidatus Diapherotrites archaeon]|uniref:Uncharacterized protein n=1 Tax=Candidatus Iainarchaeum sp. TaxID=3101447 RepID=A0A2D6M0A8_9ARCH|nr:hypothetical protein [Candidatus Diapherotrites archaeon]
MRNSLVVAVAFLVIAMSYSVFGAGLIINQTEYLKGETITISGTCSEQVQISLLNLDRKIFEESAECLGFRYEASYQTSFSDPSGFWNATAMEGEVEKNKKFRVLPTKESQFYVIIFLSPSEPGQARTSELDILVRVTDAGQDVDNADVFTWTAEGEKIQLEEIGSGNYRLLYNVPVNADLGRWALVITAEKNVEGEMFGGENTSQLTIENAPIAIEVLEPATKTVQAGSELSIKVSANYENGKLLANPIASVQFNGDSFEMDDGGAGNFAYSLPLELEDTGAKKVLVNLEDEFGNENTITINLSVVSSPFAGLLELLPVLVVLIVAGIIFAVFLLPKLRAKESESSLENRRNALEKELKKLQDNYFNKGNIKKEVYNKKKEKIETELVEVRKRLK